MRETAAGSAIVVTLALHLHFPPRGVAKPLSLSTALAPQEADHRVRVLRARNYCRTLFADSLGVENRPMTNSDAEYDYDRYRRLLAEASDEAKRLAFINLLIEEKARDKLAEHFLRARLSGLGLKSAPWMVDPRR
jgi:hypothetical protein